jgi:3-oxo-5-alpha-steroid 4-dehydrogenase 1
MMTLTTYHYVVAFWIVLALALVPLQLKVTAPYGRHTRKGWGPMIDNRWGWFWMEIVSPLVFGGFFLAGPIEKTAPMWLFFALWMAHYFNRSIIFPLRTRTGGKKMPLSIALSAAFFNLINGSLNGYWLGFLAPSYPADWLATPIAILGLLVFLVGMAINVQSDHILIHLRKPGEQGYKIPTGGLFKWVSCPNHFGEIIEWTGFAILCWNLPALSFAIWTAANLIPRALSHHQWYQTKFDDYPEKRKAVIPGVL